ncbi:hypothetical protein STRCI_007813 [Streptomyces cinnabarinus]|uniref:Ig-like domain-containing protein n=1 Tax=Streptomyces cinnabarinus TaxID=67287 RepID=A0ABY7KT60_9ACTN|nr:hypothetical protein [Streptomyces cinnabarinus]WAZ26257.1 hypothetical protein STRCI_007813 [Streptomyces cinnabarinus]
MTAQNEHSPGSGSGSGSGSDEAEAEAEYSATVLASHWIQRPPPENTLVDESPSPAPSPPPPDRVDGTLLRFGPGVTAAVAHRTLPVVPTPPAPPRRRWRRHALPAVVLICVLAFLAWQRLGPSVEVDTVTVTAQPQVLGCDGTADIVGVVRTNGQPGTLSYRWTRSDGTASGVLREVVVRDQEEARLHLKWTFQGKGQRTALAELHLLSPTRETVTARFTYNCS